MIKHCSGNSQINFIPQQRVILHNFSLQNKQARGDIIHSQREIKEILDPEKHTFSINSERKSTQKSPGSIPLPYIPCHRCEKSARESRNSHHLITQCDNIHARAHDTCVDQREYMTSGWRNFLKIEKLFHIMGTRASQHLRSPSLIMAPDTIQRQTHKGICTNGLTQKKKRHFIRVEIRWCH